MGKAKRRIKTGSAAFPCLIYIGSSGKNLIRSECQEISKNVQTNKNFCMYCKVGLGRQCIACAKQGIFGEKAEIARSEEGFNKGLCLEHLKNGADWKKPKFGETATPLPGRPMPEQEEEGNENLILPTLAEIRKMYRDFLEFGALPSVRELTLPIRKKLLEDFAAERSPERIKIPAGEVRLDLVRPKFDQPRKRFYLFKIFNLAKSRTVEQITPIMVYKIEGDKNGFAYGIVAGERRFWSDVIRGAKSIRDEITSGSERDIYRKSAIENYNRENLEPLETHQTIMDMIKNGESPKQISDSLGMHITTVYNYISIGNLVKKAAKLLEEGAISFMVAVDISKLPAATQANLCDKVIGLTRKAAQHQIRNALRKTGQSIRMGARGRKPSDDFWLLRAMLDRIRNEVGVYLEWDKADFDKLFYNRNPKDRQELIEILSVLMGNLEYLSDFLVGDGKILEAKKEAVFSPKLDEKGLDRVYQELTMMDDEDVVESSKEHPEIRDLYKKRCVDMMLRLNALKKKIEIIN